MSENINCFVEKFKLTDLTIYETDCWVWSLRPFQATIGSSVLSLKRECSTFGELKEEEFSDLHNIITIIEETLKKTFDYDIMNYLMLMMIDKQVHYHVIPRYEKKIFFGDESWQDLEWPSMPNLSGDETSMEILMDIKEIIIKHLSRLNK